MIRLKKPLLALICIASIVLTGCGEKQEKPEALNELEELNEWRKLPQANFAIPPYARYLEGNQNLFRSRTRWTGSPAELQARPNWSP